MANDSLNDQEDGVDDNITDNCKYCGETCDPYEKPALNCIGECSSKIHVKCLKRGDVPGSLLGDVFFDLTCAECSSENKELIIRGQMSWLKIIVLALYNLREKSSGISKRGYFHWKSDISTFVDKNWNFLFEKGTRKSRNWIGTISGTLSHHSKSTITIFKSGTSELNESGWWRLSTNDPPEILISLHNNSSNLRKKPNVNHSIIQEQLLSHEQEQSPARSDESICSFNGVGGGGGDDSNEDGAASSSINGGESSINNTPSMFSREYVQPSEIISDFLMADDDIKPDDVDLLDIDDSFDIKDHSLSLVDLMNDYNNKNHSEFSNFSSSSSSNNCDNLLQLSQLFNSTNSEWNIINNNSSNPSDLIYNNQLDKNIDYDIEEYDEESSNDSSIVAKPPQRLPPPPPPPSLFKLKNPRDWPWKKKSPYSLNENNPQMSKYEEEYLLSSVNKSQLDTMPIDVRRFYRKLAVRKLKRERNLPLLDIDTFGIKLTKSNNKEYDRIIDRYINDNLSGIFEQRLQGYNEPIAVHSPYTNRLLKPFIRRDVSCKPLWLRVMNELKAKVNRNNSEWQIEPSAPIDYCYIRPHHIPAINSLCRQFFWPGVDLTECLQYPDFTCVVLYKKLVIGFAILVPDVGYNEAYISFFFTRPEWRRSGIGTFMLYHLIQTCMGKDVTLHVSVTNPAVILYQKFCFKIEEFVQDFYDKYLPAGSKDSRHALFLRLSR
ncbi:hypothetical protein PV328_011347 [Microctonus aethiopoides]|uniref:N-acetyltransferase domain-containing protein n=1 Tax=Microctonus aethiopoides TaxID=144406 RepID=A0AA39EXW2_9HYME|nr:hypothetical protein PV328_011347 [Microctonus aethiopoides]